jgi:hypothetical protein
VPTKVVARHENWGFLMDACWSISASFPLPHEGEDESLEDEALPMTVEAQREEALAYNYGMPMPNAVREEGEEGGGEGLAPSAVTQDAVMLAQLFGAAE